MTPKEKAEYLVEQFYTWTDTPGQLWFAKQCALIAIDEMISVLNDLNQIYNITPAVTYWQEVKEEIKKL